MRGCCAGIEQVRNSSVLLPKWHWCCCCRYWEDWTCLQVRTKWVFLGNKCLGSWPPGVRRSNAFTEAHGVSNSWMSEAIVTPPLLLALSRRWICQVKGDPWQSLAGLDSAHSALMDSNPGHCDLIASVCEDDLTSPLGSSSSPVAQTYDRCSLG